MDRSAMTGVSLTCKPRTEVSRVSSPAGSQQVRQKRGVANGSLDGESEGGRRFCHGGLQVGLLALAVVFIELKYKLNLGLLLR